MGYKMAYTQVSNNANTHQSGEKHWVIGNYHLFERLGLKKKVPLM